MYPIVKKEQLADKIFLMDVKAERVGSRAKQAIRTDRNSRPNALIAPGTNRQAATFRLK